VSEAIRAAQLIGDVADDEAADGPHAVAHAGDPARLAQLVQEHHVFVWRSLRRLGVPNSDVDDATQKVFLIAARRLGAIAPSQERSFLFATAMRTSANERRAAGRRRYDGACDLDGYAHDAASPEQAAADRSLLDRLLEPLSLELRSVFVLFELEQMTTAEIAAMLRLPIGTAASRLRRAREIVGATIARLKASERRGGGR
jgi:RNA polymerase sigma-70 factor (ECF subfamily)